MIRLLHKEIDPEQSEELLHLPFSADSDLEQLELSDYREKWEEYRARFISEEPIFGAVSQSSLSRFLSPQYQSDHDAWLHHTKGNPALSRPLLDMFTEFAQKLFGAFAGWDDQYFKMRYLQYELVRLTVCNARRDLWFCSGILYWMLNDCWPAAMGWSLCDYYAQEKAGLFALRQYAQPVSVSIQPENGGLRICIGNILPDAAVCNLNIWRVDLRSGTAERVLEQADISCAQSTDLFVEAAHSEHTLFAAELQVHTEKPYSVRNWYRTGCPYLKKQPLRCAGAWKERRTRRAVRSFCMQSNTFMLWSWRAFPGSRIIISVCCRAKKSAWRFWTQPKCKVSEPIP